MISALSHRSMLGSDAYELVLTPENDALMILRQDRAFERPSLYATIPLDMDALTELDEGGSLIVPLTVGDTLASVQITNDTLVKYSVTLHVAGQDIHLGQFTAGGPYIELLDDEKQPIIGIEHTHRWGHRLLFVALAIVAALDRIGRDSNAHRPVHEAE